MPIVKMSDLDLRGKRVFLRADLNVPQDDDGKITDDTRIRASVPAIAPSNVGLSNVGRAGSPCLCHDRP